ncbi:MAG: Fic family protein, partial [Planctomycetes bacterium]|nr:Fic family protein [Planctomycetota bacterium]
MSDNLIPQPENLICTILQIRQGGIRSVNVEQDLRNSTVVDGYVLTAQSQICLRRILNRFNTLSPNRSWTLTGPYGSGKSYFSLFLMNLLCTSQPSHLRASQMLRSVDNELANQAFRQAHLDETQGLWPVPIVGYRSSFHECFKQGFRQAIHLLGNPPQLEVALTDLENWSPQTESRAIIRWIQNVLRIVTADPFNYAGMLLVFDEMGKPLEFAYSHPEEVDVYLLQELAEYANRSGDTPFLFIGVLHQAFERYAALLDNTTQREWAKVQGRFEDIAFQEPPSQQMWLLANAIEYRQPERIDQQQIAEIAQRVAQADWRPPMMPAEEFSTLCSQTYPLHPTVLVALPHLFRKLAQNERSIFVYLASHEPFGFQEFIQQHHLPEFIYLKDLFDYLAANFQSRLYASGRARVLT